MWEEGDVGGPAGARTVALPVVDIVGVDEAVGVVDVRGDVVVVVVVDVVIVVVVVVVVVVVSVVVIAVVAVVALVAVVDVVLAGGAVCVASVGIVGAVVACEVWSLRLLRWVPRREVRALVLEGKWVLSCLTELMRVV